MDKTRFSTSEGTVSFPFTPQLHCDTCPNKCCGKAPIASEVPEQVKPLNTPEEREKTRERYSTFNFDQPGQEEELKEGPTTKEIVDKTKGIFRAIDTQNCIGESVKTRARFIHGAKVAAEFEEHQRLAREERVAEWTQRNVRKER